ncbi:Vegetative incompatibility protein HET-E-1 [Colletotrichum siamense]|nr:Vegetative incompatibility protein HET-E-1 [Colletotrichum siamense]KAF4864968.1 Vegetative incompatibility protein HET-E-1 [Colletotrichum siamense]
MRLIHIENLDIQEFFDTPPPYAILSHTWEKDEVTFRNVSQKQVESKAGWLKIASFCKIVNEYLLDPVEYVWVDTCCIDKSSSEELSEGINSMFRYYKEAVSCFVYLTDVVYSNLSKPIDSSFERSRWFTRGWTLQELIAPTDLLFFDKQWRSIETKVNLASRISHRTKVDEITLISGDWSGASIARRMSWAATRETTRLEDIAYCLLGLFDVHMPLLYGEGSRAFIRLQEEILRQTDDYSLLAWDASRVDESIAHIGVLAAHPIFFKDSGSIDSHPAAGPISISNLGIHARLPFKKNAMGQRLVHLPCSFAGDVKSVVVLDLAQFQAEPVTILSRARSGYRVSSPSETLRPEQDNEFYLLKMSRAIQNSVSKCCLTYSHVRKNCDQFIPVRLHPHQMWASSESTRSMTLALPADGDRTLKAAAIFWCAAFEGCFAVILTLRCNQMQGNVQLVEDSDGMLPDRLEEVIAALPEPDKSNHSRLSLGILATINVKIIRGAFMFAVVVTQLESFPRRQQQRSKGPDSKTSHGFSIPFFKKKKESS